MYTLPVLIFAVLLHVSLLNAKNICPDGETYNNCGPACPASCEFPVPIPCRAECVKGCFCNGDTVRNSSGNCVPREQCCPQGEIFNQCGTACPPSCTTPIPEVCTKNCVLGCFCPEDKVRDENGKCVPLTECCPAGEVYNECGSNCPPKCNQDPSSCIETCNTGCFCPEGKVRNETGSCVAPDECCPVGEIYKECGSNCPPKCNQDPIFCTETCSTGCFCPEGKVRNETGSCVGPEECCPPGEVYEQCGSNCPPTCKQNPRFCTEKCVEGCFCPKGKVRNDAGKCVAPEQCCPADEVYEECGSNCPPTCENPYPHFCSELCKKGCFCPKGKLRNKCGECVVPAKCCPRGEIYEECGTACPATCENPLPDICTLQCVSGCFCADDKVRNTTTGQCVYPTQCLKCPQGETFIKQTTCEPICPNTDKGDCRLIRNNGCTCIKGLIRDIRTGKCVGPGDCSKCGRNKEFRNCGPEIEATCQNPDPGNSCCKKGCYCIDGYILNETNGRCIRKQYCNINCREPESCEEQ